MAKEMAMKASIYNGFITAIVQGSDDASACSMLEGRVMQQSRKKRYFIKCPPLEICSLG
jgi:hypothetical protein